MKKRIYKINNKNLVTGNPNEVTENEILVKENNDGTVELSHRNNGTLETLGSGNKGGNEGLQTPIVYMDLANNRAAFEMFAFCPSLVRVTIAKDGMGIPMGTTMFVPGSSFFASYQQAPDMFNLNSVKTLMFPDVKIMGLLSQELMTCREFIGVEQFDALPRITEEQFYDLTLPTE
jgi:hypothetical protein